MSIHKKYVVLIGNPGGEDWERSWYFSDTLQEAKSNMEWMADYRPHVYLYELREDHE